MSLYCLTDCTEHVVSLTQTGCTTVQKVYFNFLLIYLIKSTLLLMTVHTPLVTQLSLQ